MEGQYYDVGSLNIKCNKCYPLHFKAEKVKYSSESSPRFVKCYNNGAVAQATPPDPPGIWHTLLADSALWRREFRNNTRAYNNFLAQRCAKAERTARRPGTSTFNPMMTLHGHVYHYLDAMVPPYTLSLCFLSVYKYDTDYAVQGSIRTAAVQNLGPEILQQLTAMLHN